LVSPERRAGGRWEWAARGGIYAAGGREQWTHRQMPKWPEVVIRPPPRERLSIKESGEATPSTMPIGPCPVVELVASQPKTKEFSLPRPPLCSSSLCLSGSAAASAERTARSRQREARRCPVRDCKRVRPRPGWRSYTFCVVAGRRRDGPFALFFIGRCFACRFSQVSMLDTAAAALI
jgi:hypothetical protein